jgi:hypothetical protein
MLVLDFLAGKYSNAPISEYRVVCSGELYNGNVQTFDWRKSDATRRLLTLPFPLNVVSQPFHAYPQELSLRLPAPNITERTGNVHSTFTGDDDITEDVAVLLTVFLRRLLTIYVKVQTIYSSESSSEFESVPYTFSLPICNAPTQITWRKKQAFVLSDFHGIRKIDDYNPRPLPVMPQILASKFSKLTTIAHKETYVLAARLYAQAMRIIQDEPDMAYQLLVYLNRDDGE